MRLGHNEGLEGTQLKAPRPMTAMTDTASRKPLTVLGIETSCDETAAAVVRATPGAPGRILSNVVFSQLGDHAPYGGVVPEIAARAHVTKLDGLIARALAEAGVGWDDLDGVAATAGPGLIGGVIVGLMTAKGIAAARGLPFVAVNHLEGHALSARLGEAVDFPYLLLLVSGGHCELLTVEGVGRYRRLEAFDKTAKLMGLGYPGGPAVERAAEGGDAARFDLPRPLTQQPGCDFSFSGLKTAVRTALDRLDPVTDADRRDLAASFQRAVADCLADRVGHAMTAFEGVAGDSGRRLVVAGGVAANATIRAALGEVARARGYTLHIPPPALCTDNGAMIALAGIERLAAGLTDGLDAPARARWPLEELAGRG
jgi:N6-L-threonylcarbamoyladenine synthase